MGLQNLSCLEAAKERVAIVEAATLVKMPAQKYNVSTIALSKIMLRTAHRRTSSTVGLALLKKLDFHKELM